MKKALLTVVVILAALSVQAQSFRIGVSGGVYSTWLMNKNVFDQDDRLDIASSFGGRFGIDAIYAFNDKAGLSVGFNFISGHNQKYTGEDKNYDYDYKTKLRYLDVPILFRLTSSGGTYFEIGPQIGLLMSAEEDYENSISPSSNYSGQNVKDGFNSTNIAALIGFGVDIDVTENLYITTGIRLGYGFTDVTKEFSIDDDLDVELPNENADYLTTISAHIDDDQQFNYEKTSRVFGGLHIGVSYKFGGE
jgi:opacity protein-like surface antigen